MYVGVVCMYMYVCVQGQYLIIARVERGEGSHEPRLKRLLHELFSSCRNIHVASLACLSVCLSVCH